MVVLDPSLGSSTRRALISKNEPVVGDLIVHGFKAGSGFSVVAAAAHMASVAVERKNMVILSSCTMQSRQIKVLDMFDTSHNVCSSMK